MTVRFEGLLAGVSTIPESFRAYEWVHIWVAFRDTSVTVAFGGVMILTVESS
jgi:hypothetical protein